MYYIAHKQGAGPLSISTLTGGCPQIPEGPIEPCIPVQCAESDAEEKLLVEVIQRSCVLLHWQVQASCCASIRHCAFDIIFPSNELVVRGGRMLQTEVFL